MSHAATAHRDVPRGALVGAGALIVFSIALAAFGRLTGIGTTHVDYTTLVQSATVRFEDRADGGISVIAPQTGDVIESIAPGTDGFVRTVLRSLAFLATALAYAATWLAAAMLFSVLFRSPATSALCTLGLWMLLGVLWPIVTPFIAHAIVTPDPASIVLGLPDPNEIAMESIIARVSPGTLFGEAATAILHPATRSLGLLYESQVEGALMGSPLPLGQSLLLVWPQITGLIAMAILLFAVAYVLFQRQEIRA